MPSNPNNSKPRRGQGLGSPPFGRPLRVMFLLTSMPVGGAETLLVNLVRRLDRKRIEPFIGCLKDRDELGELIAAEVPVFDHLIRHKYDVGVITRLKSLFREQSIDALVTVGAGDKMFWGRIAGRQARLPVILSALHSTGWPDGVGRLNRLLTGITDGFIAVAKQHADYQVVEEKFPADKVFLIPNGIDTDRFTYDPQARKIWRRRLGIDDQAPVVGIVAALRSEKNHSLFLEAASIVVQQIPQAQFVIVGDGPERSRLEAHARELSVAGQVHFLGSVSEVEKVLSMMDLFTLTSHNEASPVSILEAFSCQRPVVAPNVGSIDETVLAGKNGFLFAAGNREQAVECWLKILNDPQLGARMGVAGRAHVIANSSLERMTAGYTDLVESCFARKKQIQTESNDDASHRAFVSWDFDLAADVAIKN